MTTKRRSRIATKALVWAVTIAGSSTVQAFSAHRSRHYPLSHRLSSSSPMPTGSITELHMRPSGIDDKAATRRKRLAASAPDASIDYYDSSPANSDAIPEPSFLESVLIPVVSTSLLITSNTVGASMLVLPDVAAGPGMAASTGLFLASYAFNLLSGLAIAEVAIAQRQSSGTDVPSSFQEFAQTTLSSKSAGNLVAGVSVSINALMLAFDTAKAGQVSAGIVGTDPQMMSMVWAALCVGLVGTQSLRNLSQFASILVMGLFASFAGLLLPGLATLHDPMAVMAMPGTAMPEAFGTSLLHAAPVIVTASIFQNVVPTVTRILDYDRAKITASLVLGSSMPLLMYLSWITTSLGGAMNTSGAGGLLTAFSLITVAGRSIGALMSLAGETEIFLGVEKKETFDFSAVIIPVLAALGVGQLFASDINGALQVAGSFGSPVLYGILPGVMAWTQRNKNRGDSYQMVPGGTASLALLAAGASALIGTEFLQSVAGAI